MEPSREPSDVVWVDDATVTLGSNVILGPVSMREFSVDGRRFRRGRGEGVAADGEQRITAPMPGRVVRILVKAGDEVAAKQPLVVVEAMKMENEVRADRDGTVAEIHTRDGMSVEAGALLMIIQ